METDEESALATELAVAKAKVKVLQKQLNELKHIHAEFAELKTEVKGLKAGILGLQAGILDLQAGDQGFKSGLLEMERRRALHEERQCYRQEMLFNGIKRIAADVRDLKHRIPDGYESDGINDTDSVPGSAKGKRRRTSESVEVKSPGTVKLAARASENRKNFERALDHHMQEMNTGHTMDEVQNSGKLAVKYSEELLKNFL